MNRAQRYCWLSLVFLFTHSSSTQALVSEADFEAINKILLAIHSPIIESTLNSKIDLVNLYSDFGGAFKVDSTRKIYGTNRFVVTLTGEIPHHERMSKDGYAIVACHELGHILGALPRQKKQLENWSSVEGQADYYATNQCMWKFVEHTTADIDTKAIDEEMSSKCQQQFGSIQNKVYGCLRILSGIQSMIDYFNTNKTGQHKISIHGLDPIQVTVTLQRYPSNQCRIDTWIAGLFGEPRPFCWFNKFS